MPKPTAMIPYNLVPSVAMEPAASGSTKHTMSTLIVMLIAGHTESVHGHQRHRLCDLLKFVIAQLLVPCAE
jgi:hypothetical protein